MEYIIDQYFWDNIFPYLSWEEQNHYLSKFMKINSCFLQEALVVVENVEL